MGTGALLGFGMCDADKIVRSDNSRVILRQNPTWRSELWALWETLRFQPSITLLFPMFFASNFFYTYQFNGINAAHFDTRTRALNNLLYWLAQIAGALVFGYTIDSRCLRRSVKAKLTLVFLFAFTTAVWGGGYVFQSSPPVTTKMDWTQEVYIGPLFLYIIYGFYDAIWQSCVYW